MCALWKILLSLHTNLSEYQFMKLRFIQNLLDQNTTNGAKIVLNFGDEEATGIKNGQCSMVSGQSAAAWYTLDGRQMSSEPTVRGIYVRNGKKVAIK